MINKKIPSFRISIHALRGEGDRRAADETFYLTKFQSTPSVGRATSAFQSAIDTMNISIHALRGEGDLNNILNERSLNNISIHALRGEGDGAPVRLGFCVSHFNPRPPWGGRPKNTNQRTNYTKFQSTPSVGRATNEARLSSTALAFQSTPSVGRATAKIYKYATLCLYIVHIKLYIFATAVLFT